MAENRGRTSQRRQLKNLQGKRFSTSRAWKGRQTNVWGRLPASTEQGERPPAEAGPVRGGLTAAGAEEGGPRRYLEYTGVCLQEPGPC